ncbi:MAG: DNA-directed RNA polymerase subunit D [Candidatus Micrarchaeota archaeon]
MQITIVKNEMSKMEIKVKDTSVAMMNALRRTITSGLETFAIDELDVYENNSAMFNDYIANRLALVPLTYEESHAEKLEMSLNLNAEGPCMVYSRDLRSSDEAIKVYNENIPIMKLGANQKLRLEAKIAKGMGRDHAKFQCALASYEYNPEKKNPEFVFFIESFNNVTAEDQLKRALEVLDKNAKILEKSKEIK